MNADVALFRKLSGRKRKGQRWNLRQQKIITKAKIDRIYIGFIAEEILLS
jgi:hypothetical protein